MHIASYVMRYKWGAFSSPDHRYINLASRHHEYKYIPLGGEGGERVYSERRTNLLLDIIRGIIREAFLTLSGTLSVILDKHCFIGPPPPPGFFHPEKVPLPDLRQRIRFSSAVIVWSPGLIPAGIKIFVSGGLPRG